MDCSAETPKGRVSVCLRPGGAGVAEGTQAEEQRDRHGGGDGIELLTEEEYRSLQELGDFDQKRQAG